MRQVTLGSTGIVSPQNAFGALPIQRISAQEAVRLLRRAKAAGFTFFDTARAYSDSEEKLGLAFDGVREQITIATKTAASSGRELRQDLAKSLDALKTDYIDIYQFHTPPFCPRPGDGTGLYEEMLEAKAAGKIRHIGITNHRMDVARQAVLSGLYETLQFPFCYLASKEDIALVELCKARNVGFIAMKALSGGLLTNARAAFAWMTQFDNALPIWGVQRASELDDFIGFMQNPPVLDEALSALIARDQKELIGSFCRACGYCMPCPKGIQINMCARMIQLIRRSPSAQWLSPESQKMMLNIENCVNCGQCVKKCPYGLNTPQLLRENLADYKNILSGAEKV